jgi:hypothetical protein
MKTYWNYRAIVNKRGEISSYEVFYDDCSTSLDMSPTVEACPVIADNSYRFLLMSLDMLSKPTLDGVTLKKARENLNVHQRESITKIRKKLARMVRKEKQNG